MSDNIKAFISYSWSSTEHQQWVLNLATQLRESGVDVKLDKWDLKEGHDAILFMEQMVTNPDIKKVIVVLDRKYTEKADSREGGVGTETQIISPEIYQKSDQNKFVGVISEKNEDGKPFLPAFYKSRVYIDLSQDDIYANNFDQLLRWIYDKPVHPKPALGKVPEFLRENAISLPTRSRAARAIDQLRSAAPNALLALDDYLSMLADSLAAFRIAEFDQNKFDDAIVQNVETFLPYRDEYISVISTFARYASAADASVIHKFFERSIPYMSRPKSVTRWSEYYWDNFRFIVHELFLYTVGFLLKHERFDLVLQLMSEGYYVGDALGNAGQPMVEFSIIRKDMNSLDHRNQRLNLRRLSVRADMLEQRSHSSGLPLCDLMQADFILFFFHSMMANKEGHAQRWWPDTLLYFDVRETGPFEIFARGESKKYFERIRPLLGVQDKNELGEAFKLFGDFNSNKPLYLPRWNFHSVSLSDSTNFTKLATRP